LLLAASADGFTRVGAGTLVMLGVIAAARYGVDVLAAALGVRRLGASSHAMAGAAIGTLLGLFLGLLGVIVGPFAGAVVGELTVHRNLARAGRCGRGGVDWIRDRNGREGRTAFSMVLCWPRCSCLTRRLSRQTIGRCERQVNYS
jgi:hypothetical protein